MGRELTNPPRAVRAARETKHLGSTIICCILYTLGVDPNHTSAEKSPSGIYATQDSLLKEN